MSSLNFSTPFAVNHWLNSPTLELVVPSSMCPVMMSSSLRQSSIKKQNFCRSYFRDTTWWVRSTGRGYPQLYWSLCLHVGVWVYLEVKVKTDDFFGALGFETVSSLLPLNYWSSSFCLPSTGITCVPPPRWVKWCWALNPRLCECWASTLSDVFVCFETGSSCVAQSHSWISCLWLCGIGIISGHHHACVNTVFSLNSLRCQEKIWTNM